MTEPEKNAIHLSVGSERPENDQEMLRLHNMHFCPFCQRVRIILKVKGVETDKININLREKPEWFYGISPLGKVPALQKDDQVMYESMVICDYLNEAYPDPPLYPKDPWQKAMDKGLIETYAAKVVSPFHKVFNNPQEPEEFEFITENVNSGLDIFEAELDKRGTTFFFGNSPGMIDFALFPWFERFKIAQKIFTDLDILPDDRFPKLTEYVKTMNKIEVASSTSPDIDDHIKFIKSHLAGEPEFDIGV